VTIFCKVIQYQEKCRDLLILMQVVHSNTYAAKGSYLVAS